MKWNRLEFLCLWVHSFLAATAPNYYKLSGLINASLVSYTSRGQKSNMGLPSRAKIKVLAGLLSFLEALMEKPVSWPFPVSAGWLLSLACGPYLQ